MGPHRPRPALAQAATTAIVPAHAGMGMSVGSCVDRDASSQCQHRHDKDSRMDYADPILISYWMSHILSQPLDALDGKP
jgi:hypothetical protein